MDVMIAIVNENFVLASHAMKTRLIKYVDKTQSQYWNDVCKLYLITNKEPEWAKGLTPVEEMMCSTAVPFISIALEGA